MIIRLSRETAPPASACNRRVTAGAYGQRKCDRALNGVVQSGSIRRPARRPRPSSQRAQAQRVGEELRRSANVHVVVDVLTPRDPAQSGYVYFDGRQNRPTAELVTQFHDIARRNGVAPWSAQLRGAALPAQGEYTPDRLDIVLPPLPPPPPPPAEPVIATPAPG